MASLVLASAQSPPPKCPVVSVTQRNPHCWSNLPLDLVQSVFERLGFSDFERAKEVCSSWQSGSRQSKPNNMIPWMVLFPLDKNYCLLFNPEDKEKLYKTQHLGDDFAKSFCLATCGSWILMQPHYRETEGLPLLKYNLYILNLITCERIDIPAFESKIGLIYPMLWIDEKTKDHLVIGMTDDKTPPVCFKKGDNSWKQIPQLPLSCEYGLDSFNMVYKDHKVYCLDYSQCYIFDFSGEIPLELFRISVRDFVFDYNTRHIRTYKNWKYSVVVTLQGDVLIIKSTFICPRPETWYFNIYKMNSSKGNKWEEIVCLGDESIFLDLGITLLAKDLEGITGNSIYFTYNYYLRDHDERNEIFIYNLDTKNVEKPHQFVSSSIPLISHVRWFIPNFKRE